MCTDRQSMVDEILFGESQVMHSYVPTTHPLYPDDMKEWPYDVTAANRLLDSAGYLDKDGDGFREDSETATRFEVSLMGALGNQVGEQLANMVKQNLADCGVDVRLELIDGNFYFADGPEGPLFGRHFDLASFPWLISIEPNCSLYLSSQIPGPENGWNSGYNNETGFISEDFDAACLAANSALPGLPGYEENHEDALRIWSEEVPIIPLFARLKVAAAREGMLNFIIDPTQESELWNLYDIDFEN
jgi:peptide/nickel transport system substrate-binding protein